MVCRQMVTRTHCLLAINGGCSFHCVKLQNLTAYFHSWRNLFNANLDSPPARRKSLEQLQKELRDWEKSQRSGKTHAVTDTKAHQVRFELRVTECTALLIVVLLLENSQGPIRCPCRGRETFKNQKSGVREEGRNSAPTVRNKGREYHRH